MVGKKERLMVETGLGIRDIVGIICSRTAYLRQQLPIATIFEQLSASCDHQERVIDGELSVKRCASEVESVLDLS